MADRKIAGVGAIHDQELVLEQKGLRNEGTDGNWAKMAIKWMISSTR
ncbi:MAG: hypothetical protein WBW14_31445 [Candidatus Acidiferrum sp.]